MPTAKEFEIELHRMMLEAVERGNGFVEINAGDLHKRVGDYPDPNLHRMPVCCEVMRRFASVAIGDVVLVEPLKGMGASLTIRYVIPRPDM